MRQEEWNDVYIALEEVVNHPDFPKTEEQRNQDKVFCEAHADAIRKLGELLQEDLKKKGVLAS
jgi:hypothetical protein